MRLRTVTITTDSDFADVEALPRHPNVIKCWRLPRSHTLIEFYHPVFDRIFDPDWTRTASPAERADPVIMAQSREAVAEMHKLLAPLYRDVALPTDRTLSIQSRTAFYRFFTRGSRRKNFQWPQLGVSLGWGEAMTIRVAGRLSTAGPDAIDGLRTVFGEWIDCMTGLGELVRTGNLRFSGEHFSVGCEFANSCGDAVMALFILVTATRNLTSLNAVGFFDPTDYSSPYERWDGPGKDTPQVRIEEP